mmetsp:Transcript_34264/g.62697  ORF Transcript_34264/g.62697 Transcript_34264/m.62697 type:complete len:213 (+) Transcript_34264:450-1088(+)
MVVFELATSFAAAAFAFALAFLDVATGDATASMVALELTNCLLAAAAFACALFFFDVTVLTAADFPLSSTSFAAASFCGALPFLEGTSVSVDAADFPGARCCLCCLVEALSDSHIPAAPSSTTCGAGMVFDFLVAVMSQSLPCLSSNDSIFLFCFFGEARPAVAAMPFVPPFLFWLLTTAAADSSMAGLSTCVIAGAREPGNRSNTRFSLRQ